MYENVTVEETPGGNEVLLTGATGFLGKVVLHELVRRRHELGIHKVHTLLRVNGSGSVENRFETDIASSPCFEDLEPDWRDSVEVIGCELSRVDAGIDPAQREAIKGSVTHVINCAASVQFNLPVRDAATANVATALEMLELARGCRNLKSLVNVSTAYVTPHAGDAFPVNEELAPLPYDAAELFEAIMRGDVDEQALLGETGHPNTYTLTKCIAEHLLWQRRGDAPLTLVRPSIISSSLERPRPGWIDSPAAFALFAAQIGSGRMRAVIARPQARLDVIPCDTVADRLIDASFRPNGQNGHARTPIVHAVAGSDHSPQIRACIDTIETFFKQNPDTRWRNRDLEASVRYLGPDGPLFRFNHWLYHERPATSQRLADSLSDANRKFAYFTQNTFQFRSSVPFDVPGFDATRYVETICKGVAQHLMGADNTAVPIAGRAHPRSKKDLRWALTQKKGNAFIRLAAYKVVKTLRKCMDGVTFDKASFEKALAEVPEGAHLVLVPSHRSYLDFVLCSTLMFARPDLGIAIPHIAATSDFARIPIISWLIVRLHAFYLQRGLGREDRRLTDKVRKLTRSGRVIEFFIEGQRSRSRQFLTPKRGLLRCLQSTDEEFAVLPVAFSYERLPEEVMFEMELLGEKKPPMRLRDLLRWYRRVQAGKVSLGSAHIACGRPIRLGPDSDIHTVSREIMAELQYGTVATRYTLSAFLEHEKAALGDADLAWLVGALQRRGGRVLDTRMKGDIPPLHERCMRYQFEHLFYAEAGRAFAGNPAIENHLRLNQYIDDAVHSVDERGDARVRNLLQALFGPVIDNYAQAIDALGEPGAALELNTPASVVRAGTHLHLPDIEGLFEDLTGRGILAFDDASATWQWGDKAGDVRAYAKQLARGRAAPGQT